MSWNTIKTKENIENLLHLFGGFHDSCLKESYLWTDSCVDENLAIGMSSGTNVRILFQRQYENPSAIELLFEGVTKFHLTPPPENHDSIIFGASLLLQNNLFYWADDIGWQPNEVTPYEVSWISAKSVKWRDVSSWMGDKMRYGVISED
ncbi:hypothetical protein COM13_19110 [Bacillus pseudomycoides]|uniref:hypothetical protein n=1 Tax=Bacillus pseudomycoides TaxID=64104 RepID=UPI000BEE4CBC|nr:hypothetical protein [Bacillus pseudomycoides]PDX99259.1 hypothetical protein COO07_17720 [Bacillus pseudomycoides]PEK73703.1 hypothetical protein CN597_28340 [Bacillus pseudomycoides]PEN08082.1 hypothetical protein CN640_13685 [Bacillus pseudomycoides]PGB87575.1 hypothetical protein COM13_19110 [Bacillus pseudomycoides]PHE58069.1 hypothetical protein COF52_03830 [Bacillus pseudomycoides]